MSANKARSKKPAKRPLKVVPLVTGKAARQEERRRRLLEVAGVALCALSLFALLSCVSNLEIYAPLGGVAPRSGLPGHPGGGGAFAATSIGKLSSNWPANWMGHLGSQVGWLLLSVMGQAALFVLVWLFIVGVELCRDRVEFRRVRISQLFFSLVAGAAFAGMAYCAGGLAGGGVLGRSIVTPLLGLLSYSAGLIFVSSTFVLALALASGQTIGSLLWAGVVCAQFLLSPRRLLQALRGLIDGFRYSLILVLRALRLTARAALTGLQSLLRGLSDFALSLRRNPTPADEDALEADPDDETPAFDEDEGDHHGTLDPEPNRLQLVVARPRKVEPVTLDRKPSDRSFFSSKLKLRSGADYTPPPLSLLSPTEKSETEESDDELRAKSRLIERKLLDFGISGRVTHVHPGPVITLFEFEPAAGVKVGRIAALQDDLSMGLKATSIRIIAPIPKRGTVGIEIPNRHPQTVRLREILESEEFLKSKSQLTIAVGRGASGEPVATDIARMPHLLIAGSTGTGKSVFINSILLSLIYRCSPAELGLILIDPKILELSVYEGIPHLRVPVVTVPKQARAVLQWAVEEMDRRYRLMQKFGVRSIDGYNALFEGGKVPHWPPGEASQRAALGDSSQPEMLQKIVIVVDELADLMLSVGREIEDLIARLAQKARAAGVHLILATQRPSVDVITGLIKANFPARISFRVSSRVDSRTILDSMGAEKLLGRGDMLFMVPGGDLVRRVHGAFVTDEEVTLVVDALKNNQSPQYDDRIIEACERALQEDDDGQGDEDVAEEYDQFYDRAVELVLRKGQASTSMIQRAFRIGYNRAARIIEVMERDGVIGPMDGVKPRQVIVPSAREE